VTRRVIKFMSHSTLAKAQFNMLKPKYRITRGLVKFGKTRFAGVVHSLESLQRCMPIIEELVSKNIASIPVSLAGL
jgi:hypothetical protein